jgi:phosphoribosylglycinamide formyltransferase-1
MHKKIKTAILISGRGSNMKALIDASMKKDFPSEISLVISNKKNALGLEIARESGIEEIFVDHKNFASREEFDKKISEEIQKKNCEVICLAGFMRLLSEDFINKWKNKIINIHPSLLPAFKGANAVFDALNSGVKISGCTVHFVTKKMDSGPIIAQSEVEIFDHDSVESLSERILKEEHKIYPEALKTLCLGLRNSTLF